LPGFIQLLVYNCGHAVHSGHCTNSRPCYGKLNNWLGTLLLEDNRTSKVSAHNGWRVARTK